MEIIVTVCSLDRPCAGTTSAGVGCNLEEVPADRGRELVRGFFHNLSIELYGRAAALRIATGTVPYARPRQPRTHLAHTLHIVLVLHVARGRPSLYFPHPSGRWKVSRIIHFESRTCSPAVGGGIGVAAIESGVRARRTSPTAVLEHGLGAVVCVGSSTAWHENSFFEYGGRHGRPLGGSAAN